MRAIVRSVAVTCIAAAFACADAHGDVMEVLTSMVGALSDTGDNAASHTPSVSKFMSAFSKDMPDYGTLETNVTALVSNADVSSSIQPLTEEGDGQMYKIDLDWLLEVRSLEQDGPLVRRREVVHCELRKEEDRKHKLRWKIVALKPIEFFAPGNLAK
jgi:hypothetical protein